MMMMMTTTTTTTTMTMTMMMMVTTTTMTMTMMMMMTMTTTTTMTMTMTMMMMVMVMTSSMVVMIGDGLSSFTMIMKLQGCVLLVMLWWLVYIKSYSYRMRDFKLHWTNTESVEDEKWNGQEPGKMVMGDDGRRWQFGRSTRPGLFLWRLFQHNFRVI